MFTDPVSYLSLNFISVCSFHYILLIVSFLQGAVPKGNAGNDSFTPDGVRNGQLVFKCPKCCSFKPERAHHCSVCQR